MAVTDDVIAKCVEIGVKTGFLLDLIRAAGNALWAEGDATYEDFKSIADVQSDAIATLITELQALTAAS